MIGIVIFFYTLMVMPKAIICTPYALILYSIFHAFIHVFHEDMILIGIYL